MLAFPAPPAARISSAAAPSRPWNSYTAAQSAKPAGTGPRALAAAGGAGGVGFGSASAGAPTAVVASTATPVQTRVRLSRLVEVRPQRIMRSSIPQVLAGGDAGSHQRRVRRWAGGGYPMG